MLSTVTTPPSPQSQAPSPYIERFGKDRGQTKIDWLESYHTFSFGDYRSDYWHHFGALRVINDDIVHAGKGFGMHPHRDMEIITIVLSGELKHQDSLGNGSIITPGEVQRMSAGTGIFHSEENPSETSPVHLLQIWIVPNQKGIDPSYEQTRFNEAELANQWRLVASENGKEGSVTIHQDASLLMATLDAGKTVEATVAPNRQAWIHIATGEVRIGNTVYTAGDAIGVTQPETLTLEAQQNSQLLWFDLAV